MTQTPTSSCEFSLSWDRQAKIALVVWCAMLCTAFFVFGLVYIAAVYGLVYWLWSPHSYLVADGEVTIRRSIGNVNVTGIRSAHRLRSDGLPRWLSLLAYSGWISTRVSTLGECAWYVTNLENAVVLTTANGTAVVSPDDPDRFLAALRREVGQQMST